MKKICLVVLALIMFPTLAESRPSIWDWTNVEGENWTTAPRDITGCGICTSQGILLTLETKVRWNLGRSDLDDLRFSISYINSCIGEGCAPTTWNFLDLWQQDGTPFEFSDPWDYNFPEDPIELPCDPAPYWDTSRVKMGGIEMIQPPDNLEAIKQYIYEVGPVYAPMVVYMDFLSYVPGTTYVRGTDQVSGNHTITIVGYDDVMERWTVNNVPNWGDNGIGYISYDADTDLFDIEGEDIALSAIWDPAFLCENNSPPQVPVAHFYKNWNYDMGTSIQGITTIDGLSAILEIDDLNCNAWGNPLFYQIDWGDWQEADGPAPKEWMGQNCVKNLIAPNYRINLGKFTVGEHQLLFKVVDLCGEEGFSEVYNFQVDPPAPICGTIPEGNSFFVLFLITGFLALIRKSI